MSRTRSIAPHLDSFYVRHNSYNVTGIDLDDNDLLDTADPIGEEVSIKKNKKEKGKGKKKKGSGHRHGKKPKSDCNKPEHEDQPHCKFRSKPRYFSPQSPSRMNQMFTPLGYAQFYLPDLNKQTEEAPQWELEYTTYDVDGLLRGGYNGTDGEDNGRQPVPWHLLPGFEQVDLATLATKASAVDNEGKTDGGMAKFRKALKQYTPFRMGDLTIPNYVALAKRMSDDTPLWNKFARYM